jgi:hypothetical protein
MVEAPVACGAFQNQFHHLRLKIIVDEHLGL